MVCGYAVNDIFNLKLTKINISDIREFTDHLMNTRSTLRTEENQLFGRGPPVANVETKSIFISLIFI